MQMRSRCISTPFGVQDVCFCLLGFRADGQDVGEPVCWEDGGCACGFVVLVRVWLVGGMGLCDPEAECFGNYTLTRRTEEENDEVEFQVEGWKATKFKAVAVRLNLWP